MSDENTLDSPGEWDALPKLRPGEPYFALIGRDPLAPPLIVQWAQGNRERALAEHDEGKISEDRLHDELRKSTNAEMQAADMTAFRKGWVREVVEPQRASATTSYSGHELPEETKRSDAQQRARIRAAQALSNAGSELNDRAEECREAGLEREAIQLTQASRLMMNQSSAIKPTRPVLG